MNNQPVNATAETTPNTKAERERQPAESANIGLGMLIADFDLGRYEPVAVVSSVGEAREIAASNLLYRQARDLDSPEEYVIWAQDSRGIYREVQRFL